MSTSHTEYKRIKYEPGETAHVILARPEIRNAFDELMIEELTNAFQTAGKDPQVKVVVLTGEGPTFSAGADLDWMRRMGSADFDTNYQDALKLANLLRCLDTLPKPTIAAVNGPAFGGGIGLIAACDISLAPQSAFFMFSEVRIGLAPATIAPYVIHRMGETRVTELFMTARKFTACEAVQWGLLNYLVGDYELESQVNSITQMLLANSPSALGAAKSLIRSLRHIAKDDVMESTARIIAELRTCEEGREGIAAFLERRKPRW